MSALPDPATVTYAVQHNPNCPSPYLVRLPRGALDMRPVGQTRDAYGYGESFEEAFAVAHAALTANLAALAAKLVEDEKRRLIAGRYDWREHSWQDHCGDPACDNCTGFIPMGNHRGLKPEDQALRNYLLQETRTAILVPAFVNL